MDGSSVDVIWSSPTPLHGTLQLRQGHRKPLYNILLDEWQPGFSVYNEQGETNKLINLS